MSQIKSILTNVFIAASNINGGAGTVSTVSVVSANGLAGTVANPTTTPAITLSTTINALVKGNGTAFSAAVAGTDYQAPIGPPQIADRDITSGITSGNGSTTGITISNTPKGLIIVMVNGQAVSIGNGVKTKFCYFSVDGGTTARNYSAIVSGDTLYWNGVIASYNLSTSDIVDLYYL